VSRRGRITLDREQARRATPRSALPVSTPPPATPAWPRPRRWTPY